MGLSSVKTGKISGLSHICILGTIEQSPWSMGSMLDLVVGCDPDPGSNVGRVAIFPFCTLDDEAQSSPKRVVAVV